MIFLDSNACLSSPCLNGATCQTQNNGASYKCTCTPGYSGTNCQICKYLNWSLIYIKLFRLFYSY
jgi:hypothetical protein